MALLTGASRPLARMFDQHEDMRLTSSVAPSPWLRRAVLSAILLLSAALQLYRLNDWQFFSDDQALQLNVMHGLLVDHHPLLRGMALAVGQAHMPPLFYYLLALPLWIGHLDPTVGVGVLAVFQVATVYLIYRLFVLVEAPWAGLAAAALYATSGLVVYWSRFLWPNATPFFIVLALYAMVALALERNGRNGRYVILLAGGAVAAAQLQPTAVLFIPVALLWLLMWRPHIGWRSAGLAAGLVVLLYSPVIGYDLAHHFAETRAWLAYATTVKPGTSPSSGAGRGLAALELFGWRVLGLEFRPWADAILAAATAATLIYAAGASGRPRAILARLLLLWSAIYLVALTSYRGTLHPHYVEPLYPLPFLAIGLLLHLVVSAPTRLARSHRADTKHREPGSDTGDSPRWPGRRRVIPRHYLRAAVAGLSILSAVLVIGLGVDNVQQLARDHFGLTLYQLDGYAQTQGNEIALGEMRQAANLIVRSAAGRPYSFLTAVRDGSGGGYQYLLRHSSHPPSAVLQPLQYLLVEPADRPPWLWNAVTRGRWSYASGGYVRLPHLLIWRLSLAPAPRAAPHDAVAWRATPDTGGAITALAPLPGRRLLAGFVGGIAASGDGGHHWHAAGWPTHATNGLDAVTGITGSPACPRRLYAGTFDGIVVSTDGGARWGRLAVQPVSTEILSLLADPRRCNVVLAGTRRGIARSSDGGHSWRLIRLGSKRLLGVHTLAPGADGHTIYAGTTDGVWVSHDGGRTWPARYQRGEPRPALSLLAGLGPRRRLLAGSGRGVVYSGDGGITWAPTGQGLSGAVYALFAAVPGGTVLAGADSGIYLSHDSGGSWQRAAVPADLTASGFAQDGGKLYAATNQGLYLSADGGATWRQAA